MSVLSEIFNYYKESLDSSIERYQELCNATANNGLKFHNEFLNQLLINYNDIFSKPHSMGMINEKIKEYFQNDHLEFVSIDGTCSADSFSDFMVFFAAAYGVKGEIHIETQPPKLKYERWSMEQDVSLVSYVPIPYDQYGDVTDYTHENFVVDDKKTARISNIHTKLMLLSEIYLAYEMACSSVSKSPKIIFMDMSISGVLMNTDVNLNKVHLFGHPVGTRKLTKVDGIVVYAHPFNKELGLPTTKKYRRWAYLVNLFTEKKSDSIKISDLSEHSNLAENEWMISLNDTYAKQIFDVKNGEISPKFDFSASWFDSIRFFEDLCNRLFHKRENDALIYSVVENGEERNRWMSPEDVSFLIAIGIRALIEKCWKNRIMLIGVAKDSASKYFSRHYIGVMQEIGRFPKIDVGTLPWTDRSLLEGLSYQLETLSAPWATVEFDSVFMSLRLEEENNKRHIRGIKWPDVSGNKSFFVNQERLFARSLSQFFKMNSKSKTMMGHVVFLDRLIDPKLDQNCINNSNDFQINKDELGHINPMFFGDNKNLNYGQAIAICLLNVLTRNLYPEVIGYPDPLHKADWGAKSVKRKVDGLIRSSEIAFRSNPLKRTFRGTRDSSRE